MHSYRNDTNQSFLANTLTGAIRRAVLTLGVLVATGSVLAAPQNAVVVAGTGSISTPDANTTVINQNTQNMVINWSSFNVGRNETVQFIQPNVTSIALNRIFDASASQIFGQVISNGRIVLLNGNGILSGPGSKLNVGGLVASTMDMSNTDFMANHFNLNAVSGSNGAIINQGIINASSGSVALVGNSVENSGLIVANAGTVALAAGKSATLDFTGDGLLSVAVDKSVIENAAGVANGVLNSGEIHAGEVLLTAKAAQNVFDNAVNNEGVIRAGKIDSTGGTIRLLGDTVKVAAGSTLDASGDNGGGTILVGGDYQGKGAGQNARTTTVENGATLNADARISGNGGKVIVWADDVTHFDGAISAKGGNESGNGGLAEVSGKQWLDFGENSTVTLAATNGKTGELLLDPANINIVLGNSLSDLNGDGTRGDFITGDILAGDFPGATSIISTFKLNNLLQTTDVVLEATNSISLGSLSPWTLLDFDTHTLTIRAPDVNLYGHVHGDGLLNVIASHRLYLGVQLHFTELKPISLNGVAGQNSILSGGKDFVITGVNQGTVHLVNGTLEDAGNSNANTAHWYDFAFIEGISAADAALMSDPTPGNTAYCAICVAAGATITGANNFTYQPGGKLTGGIIGLDSQDTVINLNNAVSILKAIEISDAALSDPSLQVFSTVDTGVKMPCDQSEEEGNCDSVAMSSGFVMPVVEQGIIDSYLRSGL
ncbi:MAG TPA: filamentous hemagglutinin N-terminal domain-containing protein [Pseudomonadales bacterium]|nr:filamentous hemagglutinin N-terminal domain-containing protein [Pseudomonadales bacterium]